MRQFFRHKMILFKSLLPKIILICCKWKWWELDTYAVYMLLTKLTCNHKVWSLSQIISSAHNSRQFFITLWKAHVITMQSTDGKQKVQSCRHSRCDSPSHPHIMECWDSKAKCHYHLKSKGPSSHYFTQGTAFSCGKRHSMASHCVFAGKILPLYSLLAVKYN